MFREEGISYWANNKKTKNLWEFLQCVMFFWCLRIKTKLTSDVLENLLSLPVLSPGEILPPTATLDCLGTDPACKDRVLTLVVTNPTVEYQVMQGSSSINSRALVGGNRCLAGPDKSCTPFRDGWQVHCFGLFKNMVCQDHMVYHHFPYYLMAMWVYTPVSDTHTHTPR